MSKTKSPTRLKVFLKTAKRITLILAVLFLVWFTFFALPKQLFTEPTSTVLYAEEGTLLGARVAADEQWRFAAGDSVSEKV